MSAAIRDTLTTTNQKGEPLTLVAYTAATAPLVVTRYEQRRLGVKPEGYRITHRTSGLAFGWFHNRSKAIAALRELEPLTDWSRDKNALPLVELAAACRDIVTFHGSDFL